MTNKDFRRRAWELCRANFGLLLSATVLQSLISTISLQLMSMTEAPLLSTLISLCLFVLSAIISLGMVRFVLDIWHGDRPALSVLFSQKHRFFTYIGYTLLIGLIVIGITLASIMVFGIAGGVFAGADTITAQIMILLSSFVAIVLGVWFALRFEMAITCMVLRPSCGATECMRIAWRASKKNAWRLFCNEFILSLPLVLAQMLLTGYATYLLMSGQTLTGVGSLLLDIASMMITALLSGYIMLGIYSLHEHLLEKYFAEHPWQYAEETQNPPVEEVDPLLLEDEYEDIPEDEEENNSPET